MSNRGPIEITSVSTALTYTPPILWIQVISAGSGGLVVVDDNGESRTYTGLLAGDVLVGPFREITSMSLAKIRVGDSVPVPDQARPIGTLGPSMQAVTATLASGTITIATGIVVAANSEVIPVQTNAITGSTNFASLRELKASRVAGVAGVGTVVIEAVGADGAKDTDAAGAIRVVILTPQ